MRYEITREGIELRGLWRRHFFQWDDIAGFWLRDGKPLGGPKSTLPVIAGTSDQGWMTVRGGNQYRVTGVGTNGQVRELNLLLEHGRQGTWPDRWPPEPPPAQPVEPGPEAPLRATVALVFSGLMLVVVLLMIGGPVAALIALGVAIFLIVGALIHRARQ